MKRVHENKNKEALNDGNLAMLVRGLEYMKRRQDIMDIAELKLKDCAVAFDEDRRLLGVGSVDFSEFTATLGDVNIETARV